MNPEPGSAPAWIGKYIGTLRVLGAAVDGFCGLLGRLIAWAIPLMAVVTGLVILLRYGFQVGSIALQEFVFYLHALALLWGIPYALRSNGHVRVDILYSGWKPRTRALVDLMGHLILLLPLSIFLFLSSLDFVQASWSVRERSPEAGGLGYVYLLKTLIPSFGLLLALQTIAEIARSLHLFVTTGKG